MSVLYYSLPSCPAPLYSPGCYICSILLSPLLSSPSLLPRLPRLLYLFYITLSPSVQTTLSSQTAQIFQTSDAVSSVLFK
ncbi:hypothetical protein GDO81_018444 [Engystomops pustulosus]|uniref:Uncharacterized protein n=1 Tax=Engystomops pustulosus TaxID=76066 RepID=A0AAV6ZPW2_ENGPU|nr:hypothetical protein GDO81_018444 [Engystomops pustulosus]